MTETWRPVVGFEGLYEVSDLGRVAGLPIKGRPQRKILHPSLHVRGGYPYVTLRVKGRQFHRKIHHLVCEAFNGPRPNGTQTRHLDGNPLNNTPSNLAWGTGTENGLDIVRHGRHHNAIKTRCRNGHDLFGDNLYVNPVSGSRQCRQCQATAKRRYASKIVSKR